MNRRRALAICAAAAAAGCAALGVPVVTSAATSGSSAKPAAVDIYSSLPLEGPAAAQTVPLVNGIKLALVQAHERAGGVSVDYTSLDDSTAAAGEWSPRVVVANARRVAADPRAVMYIGDFNSDASELSMPILNQAGVAQVSPSNTYAGLTVAAPGTATGEPEKFRPTGKLNYMRLEPPDPVQAQALVTTMRRAGCKRLAIANDGEAYGVGLAAMVNDAGQKLGVHVVDDTQIDAHTTDYGLYAASVKRSEPNCFMFAGIAANGGVPAVEAVARELPTIPLYGGDGMCITSVTDVGHGGLPVAIADRFQCTLLPMPLDAYPGGRNLAAAYEKAYGGGTPNAYALYGYEAMKLGLATLTKLGADATNRADVVKALLATRHRTSALGQYSFNSAGDTTLRSYGLWGGSGGRLTFLRNAFG